MSETDTIYSGQRLQFIHQYKPTCIFVVKITEVEGDTKKNDRIFFKTHILVEFKMYLLAYYQCGNYKNLCKDKL